MKKVLERQPTKAITVSVDMKDVDRAAKKVCSNTLLLSASGVTKFMMRSSYYITERYVWRLGG